MSEDRRQRRSPRTYQLVTIRNTKYLVASEVLKKLKSENFRGPALEAKLREYMPALGRPKVAARLKKRHGWRSDAGYSRHHQTKRLGIHIEAHSAETDDLVYSAEEKPAGVPKRINDHVMAAATIVSPFGATPEKASRARFYYGKIAEGMKALADLHPITHRRREAGSLCRDAWKAWSRLESGTKLVSEETEK